LIVAGERLLLVEDSDELRHFLAETVLAGAGYDVLAAADGTEGLVLARDLLPDLIIADYQMPGPSGLDMLDALHREGMNLPFILITAEGSEQLAVRALRLGVSDYLIKPFDPEDLLQAIERVLAEHWTRKITEQVPIQLYEANLQLEGRLHELDTLVEIGKRVTGQLDLQQVLTRVVEAAVTLTHAEEGTLLLVDHPTGELYLYASTGTDRIDQTLRLPVSDSLAGQVIQTQRPLVITGEDLRKIKTQYFFRDLAYVPLVVKNESIGVLGVTNRESSKAVFEPHMLQFLSLLADFAAIAIENARLYAASEKERETLNTVLRGTEDAIIVTDQYNRVLFCNPAACRAFDVQFPQSRGHALARVIDHQEVTELFSQEPGSGGRSRRREIELAEGKRVLNAQLSIVKGVGRVAVMQDITHLKELDRIKSDFVTTVSHDLRSPLTSILGYIELIRRSGPLNEVQQQFVTRITSSVKSITVLIEELLELGKIEAGFDQEREPMLLQPVIRQVVDSLRQLSEAKRQKLDVRVPENLPMVLGNPLRLRQLLNNLIENAIKYTPENGQIRVLLHADNSFLVLRIMDNGIGIPPQDQPFIFDKFFRTDEAIDHFPGTGLGLSIVKGIVDAHNGRIWVESQMGSGTTFTVMLPSYHLDG
jgi:two-component system phosphate regulon sensor histidine kinase PhoR